MPPRLKPKSTLSKPSEWSEGASGSRCRARSPGSQAACLLWLTCPLDLQLPHPLLLPFWRLRRNFKAATCPGKSAASKTQQIKFKQANGMGAGWVL